MRILRKVWVLPAVAALALSMVAHLFGQGSVAGGLLKEGRGVPAQGPGQGA